MAKQVQITSAIEAQLKKSVGDDALDMGTLAVFESFILNTKPLKKGGLFADGRISKSVLLEMANLVNADGGSVPLHTNHDPDGDQLPIGRVFWGEVEDRDNESWLRAMFYIPKLSATQAYVESIEASLINEVSVGIMNKQILCSECGFDYLGEESDFGNIINATCNEGHQIGVDGVHAKLTGLRDWMELSLVSRGAAQDTEILSRTKQRMGKDKVEQLAASGKPVEAHVLTASMKMDKCKTSNLTKGDRSMDVDFEKVEALATAKAKAEVELSKANETIEGLEGTTTDLQKQLDDANAKIAELEAGSDEGDEDKDAKIAELTKSLEAVTTTLTAHAKAAKVAEGESGEDLPETAEELLASIEESGVKLHQVISTEAKSKTTALNSEDKSKTNLKAFGAFKTSRTK